MTANAHTHVIDGFLEEAGGAAPERHESVFSGMVVKVVCSQ